MCRSGPSNPKKAAFIRKEMGNLSRQGDEVDLEF